MTTQNLKPNHATVRRALLKGKTVAQCLSTLDNVCTAGTQSPDVQGSPVAMQALSVLQKTVTKAHGSLTNRMQLAQALMTAIKALKLDFQAVRTALGVYESAVAGIAQGDASVINKAGLLSRDQKSPATALEKVTKVTSKPGKHSMEAIISWSKAPGASGYALEVNFTPQNPTGPWTTLTPGTGRRRVVKAATAGAQFLVRVASLGSAGAQADWSEAILATAL